VLDDALEEKDNGEKIKLGMVVGRPSMDVKEALVNV
jgi:hypothetical protein